VGDLGDLSRLSRAELEEHARAVDEWLAREARKNYYAFAAHPELFGEEIPARAHRVICELAQRVLDGDIRRLMIFAPPGTAKSTYISKRLVSFAAGYRPGIKIIGASHTATLQEKHGRESRNILELPEYQRIFPKAVLAADLKARADWATVQGSEFYGVGFDGAVTGRRADLIVVDDPFKGRNEADSETIREKTWTTFKSDLRSRLRRNGAIILMHQRWHYDDVAGRILPESWDGSSGWFRSRTGEKWFVANLQQICEHPATDLLRRKHGELLWPEWFDAERVESDRIEMGDREFGSQHQGHPTVEEAAIIKSAWWRKWPSAQPPVVDFLMQVYDTAFEEDEEADESARTTWGVFDLHNESNAAVYAEAVAKGLVRPWTDRGEVHRYHAILLEAWSQRVEFHELKRGALDSYRKFKPDRVLIEKKASGHSLVQELRRGGLPVKALKADTSKRARTFVAQVAFEQGTVWTMDRLWAQKVIRQCAQFPAAKNDDIHDTVTHGIGFLRRTFHLQLKGESDEEQDHDDTERREIVVED
jgi:predicted phage terminase large subunit-like protein